MDRAASWTLLVLLFAAPVADASHSTFQPLDEIAGGTDIILLIEVEGKVEQAARATYEHGFYDIRETFTYSWVGTVQLHRFGDGQYAGSMEARGGGAGTSVAESRSKVTFAIEDCVKTVPIQPRIGVQARLDPESQRFLVYASGIAHLGLERDCEVRTDGGTERGGSPLPFPPLWPLFAENIARADSDDPMLRELSPNPDPFAMAHGMVLDLDLKEQKTIQRGHREVATPFPEEHVLAHACRWVGGEPNLEGRCLVTGTVAVTVIAEPCNFLRRDAAEHLARLEALEAPAKGSSESQVRAFSVDAGQRVRDYLSDMRMLALLCGEEAGGLEPITRVMEAWRDAWVDVYERHGLSDEGKRDLISAERQCQLMGIESSASSSRAMAEIGAQATGGSARLGGHSPIAIHAWDQQGRHVGWNDTKGAPDLGIEGATYEGRPGGAQTLHLPAGLYKIAVVELSEGEYLLTTRAGQDGDRENATASGMEMVPLAAKPGRVLVYNALVDENGILSGPAQRVAELSDAFVEPWAPLASEASPVLAATTGSQGSEPPPGATKDAPGPHMAMLLATLGVLALAARRRV